MINDLNGTYKSEYIVHKDLIIGYIDGINKLRSEMCSFRRNKKKEFEAFKKTLNIDLTVLNLEYINFKNKLNSFKNSECSLNEFIDKLNDNEFIRDVAEEYFTDRATKFDDEQSTLKEAELVKLENERIYADAISKMFNKNYDKTIVFLIVNDIKYQNKMIKSLRQFE